MPLIPEALSEAAPTVLSRGLARTPSTERFPFRRDRRVVAACVGIGLLALGYWGAKIQHRAGRSLDGGSARPVVTADMAAGARNQTPPPHVAPSAPSALPASDVDVEDTLVITAAPRADIPGAARSASSADPPLQLPPVHRPVQKKPGSGPAGHLDFVDKRH
jgi:hypothetical protein